MTNKPKLVVCSYIVVALVSTMSAPTSRVLNVDYQPGNPNVFSCRPCAGRAFRPAFSPVKDGMRKGRRRGNDAFLGSMDDEEMEEAARNVRLQNKKERREQAKRTLAHVMEGPAAKVNVYYSVADTLGWNDTVLRERSIKFPLASWKTEPSGLHGDVMWENIDGNGLRSCSYFLSHVVYFVHADFGPSYFVPWCPLEAEEIEDMAQTWEGPNRGGKGGLMFSVGKRHQEWKKIVVPALQELDVQVLSPPCGQGPSDFGFPAYKEDDAHPVRAYIEDDAHPILWDGRWVFEDHVE